MVASCSAAPMRANQEHTPLSKLTHVIYIGSEFMSDSSFNERRRDGNSGSLTT